MTAEAKRQQAALNFVNFLEQHGVAVIATMFKPVYLMDFVQKPIAEAHETLCRELLEAHKQD